MFYVLFALVTHVVAGGVLFCSIAIPPLSFFTVIRFACLLRDLICCFWFCHNHKRKRVSLVVTIVLFSSIQDAWLNSCSVSMKLLYNFIFCLVSDLGFDSEYAESVGDQGDHC
jgi:hypothetical protein